MTVLLSGSECGYKKSVTGVDPVGFSVEIVGALSFPIKGEGTMTVKVTRMPGMTGDITVGAFPASSITPSAMTIRNVVLTNGATTAVLNVTTDGTLTDRPSNTLKATAFATGYTDAFSADQPFTLLKAGTFGLVGVMVDQAANPGFVYHRKISILRDQYPGSITFSNSSSNDYPIKFTPATTTGNSVDMEIDIPAGAATVSAFGWVIATGANGVVDTLQERYSVRSPTYEITVASPSTALTIGTIGQAGLTVTRDPGFTSAISILDGKSTGLSAIATTIPPSSSQGVLQFRVQEGTALGPTQGFFETTPKPRTVPFDVLVRGFTLLTKESFPSVQAGGVSVTDTVFITRVDFTDPIAITASAPGLTVTVDSALTKGNRAVITLSAPSSTPAATLLDGKVKGTSGTATASGQLLPTVTAPNVPPPTISVSPTSLQLQVGEQKPVTATVTNAAGTSPVAWTSKDPTVVSVSPANVAALSTGSATTFTGLKAGGPVDVVATYTANGTTVTSTVPVTVTAASSGSNVVAMYLDPIATEYTPSGGNLYRARLLNALGGEVAVSVDGGTIRYASSNDSTIAIDSISGLATTARTQVGTKTASITAVYRRNGQLVATAPASVAVVHPSGGTDMGAVQFSVAGDARRITVGQTIQFQVIVRDQTGIAQTSLATPPGPLDVTSSNGTALQITPVTSTNGFFYNMVAKSLPTTSAISGIPNVVTLKADVGGAMATIAIIILP